MTAVGLLAGLLALAYSSVTNGQTAMTNFSAGNRSQAPVTELLEDFSAHKRAMTIIMILTMIMALVGNAFLAVVICRRARRLKVDLSPVQVLILHTCAADIMFALLTILPQLIKIGTYPAFYGGDAACRLLGYLSIVPMYSSSFLLVAISADRFKAICRPLESVADNKHRRAQHFAAAAWAAALVVGTPLLFIYQLSRKTNLDYDSCVVSYGHPWLEKAYILWFAVVAWLIPSLASACFYVCVCCQVWQSLGSEKRGSSVPEFRQQDAAKTSRCTQEYVTRLRGRDDARQKQAGHMERQRNKTVKLTMTIVACNFLLYAPFCITNVLVAFFGQLLDPVATTYIMLVGNLNSCVNPWIYILFNFNQVKSTLGCGPPEREQTARHRSLTSRRSERVSLLRPSASPQLNCVSRAASTTTNTASYV